MTLITDAKDERLKELEDHTYCGKRHALWPKGWNLATASLRAALKERDDYKEVGQAYWDGLVALRAERDATLSRVEVLQKELDAWVISHGEIRKRAEEAEGKLCRAREVIAKSCVDKIATAIRQENRLPGDFDDPASYGPCVTSPCRHAAIAERVEDTEGMAKVSFTDEEWDALPDGIKGAYRKGARAVQKFLKGEG